MSVLASLKSYKRHLIKKINRRPPRAFLLTSDVYTAPELCRAKSDYLEKLKTLKEEFVKTQRTIKALASISTNNLKPDLKDFAKKFTQRWINIKEESSDI